MTSRRVAILPLVILETHVHPAAGNDAHRQEASLESVRRLRNVGRVNLQFRDKKTSEIREGFKTLEVLQGDSIQIAGCNGVHKPIVNELFDRIAGEASRENALYFGFFNSDKRKHPSSQRSSLPLLRATS